MQDVPKIVFIKHYLEKENRTKNVYGNMQIKYAGVAQSGRGNGFKFR